MKEHYSIKEISDLFNIPKSTLRYWDAEGLIHIERNPQNGYRIYTETQLLELSDIQFFRNLNVPIQQLKKVSTFDSILLAKMFLETEQNVAIEIERLQKVQVGIQTRLKKMNIVKHLKKQPYQDSQPDFDAMIQLDITNKENIAIYLNDPSTFLLKIHSPDKNTLDYGLATSGQNTSNLLWQKPKKTKRFKECLLKVLVDDPSVHNLQEHLDALASLDYKTGVTVARYLVSFTEEERFDYYHAWIEIKD